MVNLIFAAAGSAVCGISVWGCQHGRFRPHDRKERILTLAAALLYGGISAWILPTRCSDILNILRAGAVLTVIGCGAYCDFHSRKIPNRLIVILLCCFPLLSAAELLSAPEQCLTVLAGGLLGGGVMFGVLLICRLISHGGIGYGDIKLVGASGCLLGLYGTFSLLLCGVLLGSLAAAVLLITKKATIKDGIPFAPFLAAGYAVTLWLGQF